MPSMNDSSDPVDTSMHAHAGGRPLGEPARQLEQRHDAGRVVVGARHDLRRADLADHGRRAGGDDAAGDPAPPGCPASDPSAASAGPPKTGNISGGLVSLRSISAGNRRHTKAGIAGWKIRPGLGGVVVGDQHDRPARVARAPSPRRR